MGATQQPHSHSRRVQTQAANMKSVRFTLLLPILLLAGVTTSQQAGAADAPTNVLRQRLLQSFVPNTDEDRLALENSTELWLSSLSNDGSWSDVVYHPPKSQDTRSIWPPLTHVTRLQSMAACLNTPHTWCSGNSTLLAGVRLAFDYWLIANLTNPDNWCVCCLLYTSPSPRDRG